MQVWGFSRRAAQEVLGGYLCTVHACGNPQVVYCSQDNCIKIDSVSKLLVRVLRACTYLLDF